MPEKFIDELKWRGMLQDIMPGAEDLLKKEMVKGYVGFDPTADSLGVGNLVQIMTLLHFQQASQMHPSPWASRRCSPSCADGA